MASERKPGLPPWAPPAPPAEPAEEAGSTIMSMPRPDLPPPALAAPQRLDFGSFAMPMAAPQPAPRPAAPPPAFVPESGATLLTVRPAMPGAFGAAMPAGAPEPGATLVSVPRAGLPGAPGLPPLAPAPGVPASGATMVAVPRVPVPSAFGARPTTGTIMEMSAPLGAGFQPGDPAAGGTLVGMPAFQGGFAPTAPASYGAGEPSASGATLVGMRALSMPGVPAGPAPSGAFPPGAPVAGGTMVGLPRVGAAPGGFAAPEEPAAGATMIGMRSLAMPPPSAGFAAEAPVAGGTMVGLPALGAPPSGGFGPPEVPAAGGTMVGMRAVGAAPEGGFAPPSAEPVSGGTMVGLPALSAVPAGGFAAPARPAGPPPGYEILAHLGGGDLGQVFHARQISSGAEVALRIIRPDIAAVPQAVDALRDVVSLAQNAQHAHLGRLYELDESASTTLVVEYVPGKLLSALMEERGAAPAPAVIDLGTRLCSALATAHGAGLAHGRVHAGNVVLEAKTNRWVLVDVGHSYAVQPLEPLHDLYALGALLYQLATGQAPFLDGTANAPDPRAYKANVPAALAAVLIRSLAPDPSVWYPSALEFAQALAKCRGQA